MVKTAKNENIKKTGKNANVKNILKQESEYPVIGYSVFWTIRECEVLPDEMESRIDASLGRAFMPDSPTMKRALKRALEAIESTGLITKIPNGNDNLIAYTLHKKEVDRINIDLDLNKQQTLVYDKSSNKVEIKDPYKRKEIMDLIAKYSVIYTDADIRKILIDYLHKNNAVTLRETGGIYFVPSKDVRDKLKTFIESNNGSFYALGIPDNKFEKAQMHEIIKNEISSDLILASEEIKQYMAKGENRIDVLTNRIERFKEMQAKAKLYKDLLSNDIESLNSDIEEITNEVTKTLSGELENYPQANDFPLGARVAYTGRAKEKYGEFGQVVGYYTNTWEKLDKPIPMVRIKFDNGIVTNIGLKQIKVN